MTFRTIYCIDRTRNYPTLVSMEERSLGNGISSYHIIKSVRLYLPIEQIKIPAKKEPPTVENKVPSSRLDLILA